MVTQSGTTDEVRIDHAADSAGEAPVRRKRRVRVRRNQEKFPRWVRVALWLGLPIMLWIGVYLIGRALL